MRVYILNNEFGGDRGSRTLVQLARDHTFFQTRHNIYCEISSKNSTEKTFE